MNIGSLRLFILLWSCLYLQACERDGNALGSNRPGDAALERGKPLPKKGESTGLALYGYNYTNRYIDQFYVNGQGGGNLHVSGPGGGGGGTVCCVSYQVDTPPPITVRVRWVAGGCTYKATNMFNETSSWAHHYFKEVDVTVEPNVPANPNYFEVHFYPDGRVEAAITENSSSPRLKLEESREDRSDYPPCPNDKKPSN